MRLQLIAAAVVLYVILASLWGDPETLFKFWRAANMRFFVPIAVVMGYVLTYTRNHAFSEADEEEFEFTEDGQVAVGPAENGRLAVAMPAAQKIPATPEGEAAWREALATAHLAVLDAEKDATYFELLHRAAAGGVVEALLELGKYAYSRNALVEAFYWNHRANLAAGGRYRRQLNDLVRTWCEAGRPPEVDNHYAHFSEENASLARAIMNVRAGFDVLAAKRYLRQLAESGCEEAREYFD